MEFAPKRVPMAQKGLSQHVAICRIILSKPHLPQRTNKHIGNSEKLMLLNRVIPPLLGSMRLPCVMPLWMPRLSGPLEGRPTGPKLGPGQILEIWEPGNPEIWNPRKYQKWKFSKSKSTSPKMSARSGLAGKRTSRPHFMPFQAICPWTNKIKKMLTLAYLPWWASGFYSPGLGLCAGVIF